MSDIQSGWGYRNESELKIHKQFSIGRLRVALCGTEAVWLRLRVGWNTVTCKRCLAYLRRKS